METSQLEERARGKLERKNLDLIAANNLKVAGAGFGTDTNVITLIDKQQTRHLEQMSKEAAAMEILTVAVTPTRIPMKPISAILTGC